MTISNYIGLDTVITLRGIIDEHAPLGLLQCRVNKHCWHGVCLEASLAMRGRSAIHGEDFRHTVYEDGNIVLIYREGYIVPQFISLNWGQTFYCPWWQVND